LCFVHPRLGGRGRLVMGPASPVGYAVAGYPIAANTVTLRLTPEINSGQAPPPCGVVVCSEREKEGRRARGRMAPGSEAGAGSRPYKNLRLIVVNSGSPTQFRIHCSNWDLLLKFGL